MIYSKTICRVGATAAFLLLVVPSMVAAQQMGRGGPESHIERLKENLALSDEQVEQVREIFESSREACMNSSDRRSCMRTQRDETREKIDAILTDEQKTKHEELQASAGQGGGFGQGDMGSGRKGMNSRGGPEGHIERLKENLALSDEQVEQIREIFESSREACMSSSDRRSCMRAQRDETREKIDVVLTEEQKAKHEELQTSAGQGGGFGQGGMGSGRRGMNRRGGF